MRNMASACPFVRKLTPFDEGVGAGGDGEDRVAVGGAGAGGPGGCGDPGRVGGGDAYLGPGVLDALSEAGLSVPGDISLAGYDNTTFAAFSPISLTTVDQAGHHIGSEAARLLLDRIATRDRPAAQVKLAPTLVERRTTAPPAS
jgi:hypothetical protein